MNSFKKLDELSQQRFLEHSDERIQHKLQNTMSTFRFIGHVVDMYLPCMVDTMVALMGGTAPEDGQTGPETKKSAPPPPVPPSGPINWQDPERGR